MLFTCVFLLKESGSFFFVSFISNQPVKGLKLMNKFYFKLFRGLPKHICTSSTGYEIKKMIQGFIKLRT